MFALLSIISLVQVSSFCCEKVLGDGAFCQSVLEIDECNRNVDCGNPDNLYECRASAATSCEATNYCKTGTCVNLDTGECDLSPLSTCEASGGTWKETPESELPECQMGCCFLGEQTSWLTGIRCKKESTKYGLELNFNPDIQDSETCYDLGNPRDDGACVYEEDFETKCLRITKKECNSLEGDSSKENVKFHKGLLCSNENLGTNCLRSQNTMCYEDKVYFLDTCNQRANIYDNDESAESGYWNEIIEPENSCELTRDSFGFLENADSCGNCDWFETSSICKLEKANEQALKGDYVCSDLSCIDKDGKKRQNGEEWCITNSVEGEQDSPGARYGYLTCLDGEIFSTECSEYRAEVCYDDDSSGKSFAECRENNWRSCSEQDNERDCVDVDPTIRNCQWTNVSWYDPKDYGSFDIKFLNTLAGLSVELDEFRTPKPNDFLGGGYCSPKNATGLELNDLSEEELNVCINNSYVCNIVWLEFYDPLGTIIINTNENIWIDEVFSENPLILEEGFECMNKNGTINTNWLKEMNNKCSLSGDCGLSNNFLNESGYLNLLMDFVDRSNFDTEDWILEVASINLGSTSRFILSTSMPWFGGGPFSNALYLRRVKETITFNCEPWQPPRGGENCEVCNVQEMPCTEYQCKSLGQTCGTIEDDENNLFCYDQGHDDVVPPKITLIDELPLGFEYNNSDANSVDDLGVKIIHSEINLGNEEPIETKDCIPSWTPFEIKIQTDELANCRFDSKRISAQEYPDNFFDLMAKKFNHHSRNMYNHTASFIAPNQEYLEDNYNLTLSAGQEYNIYARCQDGVGNANTAEFVFQFCVDDAPDTTIPRILESTIDNGAFIRYNQTEANVTFTLSEPDVECKWDRQDKSFDDMINNLTCDGGPECKATFTGLVTNSIEENVYFIKCKDQVRLENDEQRKGDRNTMQESYKYTLYGSYPLGIKSVYPNNTKLSGSSDEIEVEFTVETFGGAEDGLADCYIEGIKFLNTGSNYHTQPDYGYPAGNHTVKIKCVDDGGNLAIEEISFEVEKDTRWPTVIRAYGDKEKNPDFIILITDEPAQCAYSTEDCFYTFADETITNITTFNTNQHLITWDPGIDIHVKCKDKYNQYPINDCSIVIRASDYFS